MKLSWWHSVKQMLFSKKQTTIKPIWSMALTGTVNLAVQWDSPQMPQLAWAMLTQQITRALNA
jgi:hypothetical protein